MVFYAEIIRLNYNDLHLYCYSGYDYKITCLTGIGRIGTETGNTTSSSGNYSPFSFCSSYSLR